MGGATRTPRSGSKPSLSLRLVSLAAGAAFADLSVRTLRRYIAQAADRLPRRAATGEGRSERAGAARPADPGRACWSVGIVVAEGTTRTLGTLRARTRLSNE